MAAKPKKLSLADRLEKSSFIRIVVRVNQCLPMLTLMLAVMGGYFALQGFVKSKQDKKSDAWRLLLSASGKMVNYGQASAMAKLLREDRESFAYLDLHGTNLRGVSLEECDLSHANLAHADLQGANLVLCSLANADLSGADLTRANLSGVDFSDANMTGAKLAGATVDMKLLLARDLTKTNLTDAKFVFLEDGGDEDGEGWGAFLDGLYEEGDWDVYQSRIDVACAERRRPPDFGLLKGKLKAPKCVTERVVPEKWKSLFSD